MLSTHQDRLDMALAARKSTQPSSIGPHWSVLFAWPHGAMSFVGITEKRNYTVRIKRREV